MSRFLVHIIFLFSLIDSIGQIDTIQHRLLWEITGNGLEKPSYLFGSMHSNDKRVFNFHDSVYVALYNAKTIALETDIFEIFDELDVRIGKIDVKYDKDGQPYSTSPKSSATAYGNEDGMPQFLDAYIEQFCLNSRKNFRVLESLEFQLNLVPSLANADWSKARLSSAVNDNERLIETYAQGDIDGLLESMRLGLEFIPDYLDKLIFQRNITMSETLDSLLQMEDEVFCAVGAGHLASDKGMIALLTQKGYNLRRVHVSFTDDFDEKDYIKGLRNYTYFNDSLNFQAKFGSKPKLVDNPETILKLIYQELGQGNGYVIEVFPRNSELSESETVNYYFPSPSMSPYKQKSTDNDQVYYEGIADAYPEGLYWCRILMNDEIVLVLKAYGGNKFMNSSRAKHFFDQVWFSD